MPLLQDLVVTSVMVFSMALHIMQDGSSATCALPSTLQGSCQYQGSAYLLRDPRQTCYGV